MLGMESALNHSASPWFRPRTKAQPEPIAIKGLFNLPASFKTRGGIKETLAVGDGRVPERWNEPAAFGFRLQKTRAGWRWIAFDSRGRVAKEGEAQTRTEAAAGVIRALAETSRLARPRAA